MQYSPSEERAAPEVQHAALLVDYQNLHERLGKQLSNGAQPSGYITDVLNELKRYLHDADATQTSLTLAYADFNALNGEARNLEQSLYLENIEPRFVPSTIQGNASEVQLCVDAVSLVHERPDMRTIVLVTGNRPYLPLVQALRRYGCHAFVVALETPPSLEENDAGDVFLNLRNLLSEEARADLDEDASLYGEGAPAAESALPANYTRLNDEAATRTLRVAEEHFGQYEEIYLTPLLRKLSEVLGSQYDPKSLVSALEEAKAVRLEKRQGYPYDYTVLIMHYDHPDVAEALRDTNYHSAPSYASDGASEDARPQDAFYGERDGYEHDGYKSDGSADEVYENAGLTEDGASPSSEAYYATDGADRTEGHEHDGAAETTPHEDGTAETPAPAANDDEAESVDGFASSHESGRARPADEPAPDGQAQ